MLKSLQARIAALVMSFGVAAVASAEPSTDYDAIVSAVDWTDVISGIASVAALVAAVLVVKRGSRMLLSMIGR